jgi:hypothetical protein
MVESVGPATHQSGGWVRAITVGRDMRSAGRRGVSGIRLGRDRSSARGAAPPFLRMLGLRHGPEYGLLDDLAPVPAMSPRRPDLSIGQACGPESRRRGCRPPRRERPGSVLREPCLSARSAHHASLLCTGVLRLNACRVGVFGRRQDSGVVLGQNGDALVAHWRRFRPKK